MRRIPVVGLGTYYTPRASVVPVDAASMRSFIYLAKDNRNTYVPVALHHNNHHDSRVFELKLPAHAYWYAGGICRQVLAGALAALQIRTSSIGFVPIPASGTTRGALDRRWPARRLAEAFAAENLGAVRVRAANRVATAATHGGPRPPIAQLLANLELLPCATQAGELTVYVDDVLSYGRHIAAVDQLLGCPHNAIALVLGCTDAAHRESAARMRYRTINYYGGELISVADGVPRAPVPPAFRRP